MVRPVHSKRKLFIASKEQKENDPAESELRNKIPSEHQGLTDSSNSLNIGCQRKSGFSGNSGVGTHSKTMVGWAEDVTTAHHTPSRPVMPMSERQQIALLMQLSSPSPPDKADINRSSSPRTPSTPSFGRGVNKRNERGETPLHVAAIKGDSDRISQLISQGADVNAPDYAGDYSTN